MKKTLLPRVALLSIFVLFICTSRLSALTATISAQTNVSCNGNCNGTATATPSGGTGPYTYSWAPSGATSASVSGLCAGAYTVTITDATLATATATAIITQPMPINLSVASNNPATCGMNNGSVSVNASGGTAPFTYNWLPSGGNTSTIFNMPPGTYTVVVTDANGCTASMAVSIMNIAGPNASVNSPGPICSGQAVQLTPTVFGGTPPYTYNWTPGSSLSNTNVVNPMASPAFTTTYTLTVTDSWGCVATTTVTVVVNPSFTSTVSTVSATCNQSNGSATASITSGGTAPFNYSWSTSATTPGISNVAAGSYTVNIVDAAGCSASHTANIANVGGPSVNVTTQSAPCANSANGLAVANVTGNAPPFTYSWLTSPPVANDSLANLLPGTYTVQVTDNAGCVSFGQGTINQQAGNLFFYAFTTSPSNCNTTTGGAATNTLGGTPPYTYLWSNGSTADHVNNLMAGTYTVTVTDNLGCQQSGSMTVANYCVDVVKGRFFSDLNGNCTFDTLVDMPAVYRVVQVQPGNYYSMTNSDGYYTIHVTQPGSYTVSVLPSSQDLYYSVNCPSGGTVNHTFPSVGDTLVQDFGRQPTVSVQDLVLSLASGAARPGFSQTYAISYSNVGTVPVSDTIFFGHDPLLTLINSVPAMSGYTAPNGYWLFNNLMPGQSGIIYMTLQVPTISNGGYIGRQLISNARIEPTASDTTPLNNGDDEVDVITASYDPNLKECWAPHMDSLGNILLSDTLLSYTIHFQNSGTDTAFTVVVKDTLPPQLDIATLEPGASSHPYSLDMHGALGQNVLTFTFNNILLPDSNVNEPASHGFVKFKIKLLPGQPIGTVITNTAANYFDFNPPVMTNTVNNTIISPLSVLPSQSTNGISIAPNPFDETATIRLAKSGSFEVELFDIAGRSVLQSGKQNGNSYLLHRAGLGSGVYICKVKAGDSVQTLRIVLR